MSSQNFVVSGRPPKKSEETQTVSGPFQTLRMNDGATYLYIGKAVIGTATSAASWQVQRITQADTTIVWADGNASFDNIWDNYASLSYS